MKIISHILLLMLVLSPIESRADASDIWVEDNKLTAAQPFPAKVRAVLPSWVGYHLLLEEIEGEERLCLALVLIPGGLKYHLLEKSEGTSKDTLTLEEGWIYLEPSIELSRFSWSIGGYRLGRIFGNDDLLFQITTSQFKALGEQGGAGQPATRSESDSEGGDKPQPESEGRSR